jgi:hypothetical protein
MAGLMAARAAHGQRRRLGRRCGSRAQPIERGDRRRSDGEPDGEGGRVCTAGTADPAAGSTVVS